MTPPSARLLPDEMRAQIATYTRVHLKSVLPAPSRDELESVAEATLNTLFATRALWPEDWDDDKVRAMVKRTVTYEVTKEIPEPAVLGTPEDRQETDWRDWLLRGGSRKDTGKPIDWKFWARYRQHFANRLRKSIEKQAGAEESDQEIDEQVENGVAALDIATEVALQRLIDPQQEGEWLCKGLVMGNVQSGKTGHYAGLISRAVDAGYKLIIVLAGQTVDLRKQTQERMDQDFGGLATPDNEIRIGVGLVDVGGGIPDPRSWTNASRSGDLKKAVGGYLKTALDLSGIAPHYMVIKKNPAALEQARTILASLLPRFHATDVPALIIDDECDQASIDRRGSHTPDPDKTVESIATINRKIRELLGCFKRRSYVGYTATPFANVFIWPEAFQKKLGADLFPDDFILSLEPPANYMGPVQVFGPSMNTDPQKTEDGTWGIVRHARVSPEFTEGMKKPGRSWELPSSMRRAIISFVLATAIRHWRNQDVEHAGMLVQCTQRKLVHTELEDQIKPIVDDLRHGMRDGPGGTVYQEIAAHYASDIVKADAAAKWGHDFPDDFSDLVRHIKSILGNLRTCVINSDSEARLEYSEKTLPTIIIGGDKLSRGFTIEGLLVTYFTRTTTFGDTLLQMGRWFGYRDGFQDLVRVYAPQDQIDMFQSITETSEELRSTFRSFSERPGFTPREWRPRVLYNKQTPKLKPTSPAMLRNTRTVPANYAGAREQTVSFDCRDETLEHNWSFLSKWLEGLGPANRNGTGTAFWQKVPPTDIEKFIEKLITSSQHHNLDTQNILSFLKNHPSQFQSEYQDWTVVLPGLPNQERKEFIAGAKHGLAERSIGGKGDGRILPDGYTVRLQAMGGSDDVKIGLRPDEAKEYEALGGGATTTASHQAATRALGPSRGVLMIYLLDPSKWFQRGQLTPSVGWMLLFGNSDSASDKHYITSLYQVPDDEEDE